MIIGRNDNPSTEEFKSIYRKLLVCNEIVYRNDRANCITNETGVLTVSSAVPKKKSTVVESLMLSTTLEIDFDYDEAIHEELEKLDQHLCAYLASTIETEIIKHAKKAFKKECYECIAVFYENDTSNNDFIAMKQSTNPDFKNPCLSTVRIVIASNKIFHILKDQFPELSTANAYNSILRCILKSLPIEELYTQSEFDWHIQANELSNQLSHKENFIYNIINQYMKLKSQNIGGRISEEERGKYIRHNNKTRVHEQGQ